jgi:hypothetical protein
MPRPRLAAALEDAQARALPVAYFVAHAREECRFLRRFHSDGLSPADSTCSLPARVNWVGWDWMALTGTTCSAAAAFLRWRVVFAAFCRSCARCRRTCATAWRASVSLVFDGKSKASVASNGFMNLTRTVSTEGGSAVSAAAAERTTVFPLTWRGSAGVVPRYTIPPDKTDVAAILKMAADHAPRRSAGSRVVGSDFLAIATGGVCGRVAAAARDSDNACCTLSSSSMVSSLDDVSDRGTSDSCELIHCCNTV